MTEAASAPVSRKNVGLRSERGPVLLAVMLTTSLVALDAMVIATAVPSIVRDLGGFSQFPWLFSTYLLAQAVSVPIYGKLADLIGRKPVMLFGVGLFLLGSVLCGAAWSMPVLIVSRVVQGLGAGAVLPMGQTIIGDLYSVRERAKVQGYLASVWGVSSVVGPAIGGLFSDYLSWRWIFFVNLPIGAVAIWFLRRFHERVERRHTPIDYLGSALLAVGFSLLILALLEGGDAWPWVSVPSLTITAVAVVLLVVFAYVERRAVAPVLPPWVFTRPILVGANLVSMLVGVLIIGITSYIPTFVQDVLGASAVVAGFTVATMTLGWPLTAAQSGRLYLRIGFRDTALIGMTVTLTGCVLLALLGSSSTVWQVAGVCFVIGLGMGLVAGPTLVAVQSVVGWERRGVVTGTNLFWRSIGSALGVAVFGALVNGRLSARFADAPAGLGDGLPTSVDDTSRVLGAGSAVSADVREFVRVSLSDAVHWVFLGIGASAVLMLVGLALMPKRTEPLQFAAEAEDAVEGSAAGRTDSDSPLASSEDGPGAAANAAER